MAYEFQVVVDSQRPHELADWWAETLGWSIEPQDAAFIRKMIAEGHASDADTIMYQGQLRWQAGVALRHPDELAGGGTRPRVLFQLVPEAKSGKNRLHLDLRAGGQDNEAIVAALVKRGATVLRTGSQGPHVWTTLADPEGNEFCVG